VDETITHHDIVCGHPAPWWARSCGAAVEREPAAVERALQAAVDDRSLAEQGSGVGAAQAQSVDALTGAAEDDRQSFDEADLPVEKLALHADADQTLVVAAGSAELLDDAQHYEEIVSYFPYRFQSGAAQILGMPTLTRRSNPIRSQSVSRSPQAPGTANLFGT